MLEKLLMLRSYFCLFLTILIENNHSKSKLVLNALLKGTSTVFSPCRLWYSNQQPFGNWTNSLNARHSNRKYVTDATQFNFNTVVCQKPLRVCDSFSFPVDGFHDCKVNVNSDMACSTDNMFLIGLFMSGVLACFGQRHLITTMPEKLDVLSGSCVQIPCAFDVPQDCSTFNSTVITSGVWIKESPYFGGRLNIVIFNSSKTYNTYQGKITGNMSWKDCTTVFFNVTSSYTNSYFFRIESRPFSATDPEKSVHIAVRGEMKEERPVSLNCSAAAPCPKHSPKLTWTLPTLFTPENQLQENSDQTKSVLSTVTFTASHLHHEKNITCTAVYPVGTSNKTAEHTMTLNVLFSPKNTSASLSPADPVSVGSCVNLTCSSTANPPVTNFTWFQICGGKPTQVASGQTYTINVTVGDGGMYYCEARNNHGIEKSMKVLLAIEGQEEPLNPSVLGIAGAGGTLGVILLIILITFFGWKRKSRLPDGLERTDNPLGQNSPVGMVYTNQAMTGEEPEEPAEDQPEEIHYGEIDFSKLRPKETPAVALDREQGQESEYAEVSVTRRGAQEPPVKTTSGSVSVPRDG